MELNVVHKEKVARYSCTLTKILGWPSFDQEKKENKYKLVNYIYPKTCAILSPSFLVLIYISYLIVVGFFRLVSYLF